ncbi:MAG: S10 family serine carboxypeptidase-like protein, partial [Terriglobales bacterium]
FSATAANAAAIRNSAPVETQQQITVNGQAIAYTARAGYMAINNATSGEPEAHLFYSYYARNGGAGDRPLAFLFGGGPGEAASWLELGGFGPKRLELQADGSAGLPPYRWSDNPQTLLADADLVFVNPVGTGFSRAASPALNAKFATALYDAASLGEFVRSFLGQYERWNSPRILVGEDFGTGRVANLASYLAAHQLPVNGVVILSAEPAGDALAGDEQYMTLLPSEIMASWYHKKLAADLQSLTAAQMAQRARAFASREYLHALYQGERMSAAERAKVLADMAHLTGLSQAFLSNNDLRIPTARYDAELLGKQHEEIANSDSRATVYLRPGGGGRDWLVWAE